MTDTVMSRWTVAVELRSPFLIPGPSVNATAADARPALDADGVPIIPGSLIRGLFRDALRTAGFTDALALLGDKSGREKASESPDQAKPHWSVDNDPIRRFLDFSDLTALEKPASAMLTRVALDSDETGAGKDGHLQFIELAAPLGQTVTFTGKVTCWAKDSGAVLAQLDKAKKLIRAIGSNKSSGFGEVEKITFAPVTAPPASPALPETLASRIDIGFTFDRPFLVDAAHTTANQFKGSEIIPGAVFKGALAPLLKAAGISDEDLTRLHIGHAFPATEGARPTPILPLSLALQKKNGGGKRRVDLLLVDDVTKLLSDGWGPPFLSSDWKDSDRNDVLEKLKRSPPNPRRDIRTRTAIDPESGTPAYNADTETGQLFSYSAVRPDGHVWVSRWHIPNDRLLDQLATVLKAGIPGIGKTRATAMVATMKAVDDGPPTPIKSGQWAVTLQTDAAMGNGSKADYQAFWKSVDNDIELVRHFADQRLVGGYQALRYPVREDGYMPYVLTRAGSVFLLNGPADKLKELLRDGLPPAAAFKDRSWRKFPFGRENGFGAIRLNVVDHDALAEGRDV